jgi:peroxiredoxin Q/BCP
MEAFQKDLKKFEKLTTQVLGVSPDSPAVHEEFSTKYGITFPLIADEKGELQKQYAPGRVTFIIDKAGIVRFIQKGVPDNKVLLKELEKLGK